MNKRSTPDRKPDLEISKLQVWIHGRAHPDSNDYWDINWLNVTIHCGSQNSDVWVTGNIIFLSELIDLKNILKQFTRSPKGTAVLETIEPNYSIKFQANTDKMIGMKISLTPDHLFESHEYLFDLRRDKLGLYIRDIEKILDTYPIIGNPSK